MLEDRPQRRAPVRSPRAVVLVAVVCSSLVGCSDGGRSGTDSVVAIEEAQAEAAAEVAEVQKAIDRQVAAADAEKAAARAAEDPARASSAPPSAPRPGAAVPAVPQPKAVAVPPRPAVQSGGRVSTPPKVRQPVRDRRQSPPTRTGTASAARPVPPPRTGTSAARPVPAGKRPPVTPPRAATVAPPVTATAPPAAITPAAITPAGRPQGAISSIDTIELVVAPGGAVSAPGGESGAAGCQPQDFSAGDVVRLTTGSGAVVHEAVLPACHLEVISAPGTGIAVSAPRFSLTLPAIAWKEGDAWILHIGARSWPLTAATLSEHSWSITVSADEGVSAGRLD